MSRELYIFLVKVFIIQFFKVYFFIFPDLSGARLRRGALGANFDTFQTSLFFSCLLQRNKPARSIEHTFTTKSIRQRALTVVNVSPRWGNCWKRKDIDSTSWLTCSTDVLIARVNVTSAQSFTRPTMFDEKLEWTVGEGALPSPFFRPSLPHPPPLVQIYFSPQPSAVEINYGSYNFRHMDQCQYLNNCTPTLP